MKTQASQTQALPAADDDAAWLPSDIKRAAEKVEALAVRAYESQGNARLSFSEMLKAQTKEAALEHYTQGKLALGFAHSATGQLLDESRALIAWIKAAILAGSVGKSSAMVAQLLEQRGASFGLPVKPSKRRGKMAAAGDDSEFEREEEELNLALEGGGV